MRRGHPAATAVGDDSLARDACFPERRRSSMPRGTAGRIRTHVRPTGSLRAMSARRDPATRPVRLDREQRQRQIVAACAGLIATRGYAATSLRDVAAAAGISTGTLLHHFRSKDELLTATLEWVADGFLGSMSEVMAVTDPVERLVGLVQGLVGSDAHRQGWVVWIAFWHEASVKPDLAAIAAGVTERSEALIAGIIQAGIDAGRLREQDAAGAAAELAALVDGVAIRLYGEHGRWTHEQAVTVVRRLIDSWLLDA
jgi:AcrR family transcriptional regulator